VANGEEPLKPKGCASARVAWCRPRPPVVTRKDSAEVESPATEYWLPWVMCPGARWLLWYPESALTNGFPWPLARHFATAGPDHSSMVTS
jgi:hypothetical protein